MPIKPYYMSRTTAVAKVVESCVTLCRTCKTDYERAGQACRVIGKYSKRWCDTCGKYTICANHDILEKVERTWMMK